MRYNIIQEKSEDFSVRIVNLSRYLKAAKKEGVLTNQVLRSGTSIAANVAEAIGAISRNEFSSKISISYKESLETKYWLKVLYKTKSITDRQFISLFNDCEELAKILFVILSKTRKDFNNDQ
jgi:four helix bundle protein